MVGLFFSSMKSTRKWARFLKVFEFFGLKATELHRPAVIGISITTWEVYYSKVSMDYLNKAPEFQHRLWPNFTFSELLIFVALHTVYIIFEVIPTAANEEHALKDMLTNYK